MGGGWLKDSVRFYSQLKIFQIKIQMSVPAKLNDASILRKFELSKKEEALKSKLFGKKGTDKPATSTTTTRGATKSSTIGNRENNNPNIPNQTSSGTVYQPIIQPSNDQIDKFLTNMESEFRELNKSTVYSNLIFDFLSFSHRASHHGHANISAANTKGSY